jgi:hypothetical protein
MPPAKFGETGYSPEDLAAVKDQVQPPPVGTGPTPEQIAAAAASGASPTEVDVTALLATMQAQMAAMAAQIASLKSTQVGGGAHELVVNAAQARDLIAKHFEFHPKGAELTRLADDVVDAAGNAVESGDTAAVRQVAGKLERKLNSYHPGPGDHHYFTQALAMVGVHIPGSADLITDAQPSAAPAIGSDKPPAKVLAGSVTG